MATGGRLNWIRIILAVIAAEVLPVLLLVLVVVVYGFTRQLESLSPEEFAPIAGNWVGPIGGFLATLLCARWVARRAPARRIAHGAAIGVGTALLDFSVGSLLEGADAIGGLFILSNAGRIVAGLLGGWLATRRGEAAP